MSFARARSTRARTRRSSTPPSALDARRRVLLAEADALKAERNTASKQVGEAIKAGAAPAGPEVAALRAASVAAGERIAALDAEIGRVEAELEDALLRIPNPADPDVPVGDADANVTVRTWGELLPRSVAAAGAGGPEADAAAATWERRPHWDVAERLGIFELERGAKIAGSGFPVYRGAGAALQRALIDFFLGVHTRENGFTEIWPPAVVNAASARGHGPDPRQGRPDVRRHARRALPGPDGRGAGHEPPPRRDLRGGRAAGALRGLHALLPPGGRRGRQGHARDPAGPPVRQGRDGALRDSPRPRPRRSSGWSAGPRTSCAASGWPTACS